MDDSVLKAMAKWPQVPDVYGWLSLDRRGVWRIRSEPIRHPGAVEFINRNYTHDEQGRWFFQNGPQRVFVTLEYTPYVAHIRSPGHLVTHCAHDLGAIRGFWLDDDGNLLVESEVGVAVLSDRDLAQVVENIIDAQGSRVDEDALVDRLQDAGKLGDLALLWAGSRLPLRFVPSNEVPGRFGFAPDPGVP